MMEEYSLCPYCNTKILDKEIYCLGCITYFDVFYSDEYDNVRYYTVLEVTVMLNLLYALFCLPITAYLMSIHYIGIINIFLPTVIAMVVIAYVILGITYKIWLKGPKINLLVYCSMLAILIHLGIIVWFMSFRPVL